MDVRTHARVLRLAHSSRVGGSQFRLAAAGVPGRAGRVPVVPTRGAREVKLRPIPRDWTHTTRLAGWLALGLAIAGTGFAFRSTWLTPPTLDVLRKLGLAAAVGVLLTVVQRVTSQGRTAGRPLERAQVLLAVAGALTMLLVDNSLARAFGVAGVASVVRFRTPVEDPGDTTVLFLAMGLGMCSGVGALPLACVGAGVVSGLLLLTRAGVAQPANQVIGVELVSAAEAFPMSRVMAVFAGHGVHADVAEWKQNGETRARFRALTRTSTPVDALAHDLKACPGVSSVTCDVRKTTG